MSDFLVDLGANATARKIIKALGLPIPMPQKLERTDAPWEERPLEGYDIVVRHLPGGYLADELARALSRAGANCHVEADDTDYEYYVKQGDAWGRIPKRVTGKPEGVRPKALIFDATGLSETAQLHEMYAFYHGLLRSLKPNGRVLTLARPYDGEKDASLAAAMRGIDGFNRSVSKELGKRGSTSQVLYVDKKAVDRLEPVLRFFASKRSAYITGQPVHIDTQVKTEFDAPAMRPLDGKVALVTGCARGIGASTIRALAREGAQVVGIDIPAADEPLTKLMAELGGTAILGDITKADSIDKIVGTLKEKFGGVDIVVHNAGITKDKMLVNMDDARWDMVLGVNLLALINLNEALLKILNKDGRIVCLSSVGGIAGNMGQANYATTKAGVIGYVKATAPTLAKKGVAMNAIAPGFIETQMTAAIPVTTREVARRFANLGQGGHPEDIAELITFLASPGAAGINGEVIRICGGNLIGA